MGLVRLDLISLLYFGLYYIEGEPSQDQNYGGDFSVGENSQGRIFRGSGASMGDFSMNGKSLGDFFGIEISMLETSQNCMVCIRVMDTAETKASLNHNIKNKIKKNVEKFLTPFQGNNHTVTTVRGLHFT